MTHNQSSPAKSSLMKQFFIVYGVLLALMLSVITGWYWFSVEQEYKALKQKEKLLLRVHEKAILDEYRLVLSDLLNLASLPVHLDRDLSKHSFDHVKKELAQTYLTYAKTRGRYDQIRYLNKLGEELVRINYYDGHPKIVADADLQDKSKRYYVKSISKLAPDEIYIPKMDLNIEHGEIEQPHKPMIRIGIGIYDKQHQETGMLILNYLGDWLLKSMNKSHRAYEQLSFLFFVNQEGYWLQGPSKDKNFAFMYPEKKHLSFKNEYPQLWQTMKKQKEGQVLTDKGLYTYMVFDPLHPSFISTNKGIYNFADMRFISDGKHKKEWVLISFLPKKSFSVGTRKQLEAGLPYVAIAMTLIAFISFMIAGYRVEQAYLRSKVRYMAYHDELTGLLNRHSLTAQNSDGFFKQASNTQTCAVFFLDLDGFKPINDKYGHHIGDEVLKVVATRISNHVRKNDLVVRIGGDEFAVIACDGTIEEGIEHFAQKLIDQVSEPIHIYEHRLQLGTSVGIATYSEPVEDINKIIDEADQAMYCAKKSGKGRYYLADKG